MNADIKVTKKATKSVFDDVLRAVEHGRVAGFTLIVDYSDGQSLRIESIAPFIEGGK